VVYDDIVDEGKEEKKKDDLLRMYFEANGGKLNKLQIRKLNKIRKKTEDTEKATEADNKVAVIREDKMKHQYTILNR
jgi:hypothetical protein